MSEVKSGGIYNLSFVLSRPDKREAIKGSVTAFGRLGLRVTSRAFTAMRQRGDTLNIHVTRNGK